MSNMDETLSSYFDTENMNYFDVEKEFFLIDSEHLQGVETRLYGYSIQNSGIYENDNLTESAVSGMNGCGIYIYVEVKDKEITIRQDFNGSFGIYLYQKDGYFALSNSFFRLLDHIKVKFPITLNRDYSNYMFVETLSSFSYLQTPIEEINLVQKNAVLIINAEEKVLRFDYIDYKEGSISLDSEEGMAVLDDWFLRWTAFFRNLNAKTDQIMLSLSGGFDSRIPFMLMLQSGINLNGIRVNSVKDTLYTHVEDYEIASTIAEYYGFHLNDIGAIEDYGGVITDDDGNPWERVLHYSMEDIINIEFHTKMAFHKELFFRYHKCEKKKYMVSGAGGESVRNYWNGTAQEFIDRMANRAQRYSIKISTEMSKSIASIINGAYKVVREKYHLKDDDAKKLLLYLRRDVRDSSHFGKWGAEDYFYNIYTLSPLLDPELRKLRLSVPECPDDNLLMAIMYARYCPKLLDFKYEGGRSMSPETIEYAYSLYGKFPVDQSILVHNAKSQDGEFHIITMDSRVSEYIKNHKMNKEIQKGVPEKYMKSIFDSTSFRKLFATCFDEEIYDFAKSSYQKASYFPMRECYAIIGITKVINDVMVNHSSISPSIPQSMNNFICESYYESGEYAEIVAKYKNYISARLDVKLSAVENPDLEVISVSDNKAQISRPEWFQKDGIGYVTESSWGQLDISFRTSTGGKITIWLRSRDVRDNKTKDKIPHWIDYKNVYYNDKIILKDVKPVWHDRPVRVDYQVKAGDVIRLHLEWTPHQCNDFDLTRQEPEENTRPKKERGISRRGKGFIKSIISRI